MCIHWCGPRYVGGCAHCWCQPCPTLNGFYSVGLWPTLASATPMGRSVLMLSLWLALRDASQPKLHLLVSCAPGLGRVSLRAEKPKAPETPLPFARFL